MVLSLSEVANTRQVVSTRMKLLHAEGKPEVSLLYMQEGFPFMKLLHGFPFMKLLHTRQVASTRMKQLHEGKPMKQLHEGKPFLHI